MRALIALVGVVILLAALKAASSIVIPFLLAGTLAIAFQPVVTGMSASAHTKAPKPNTRS